MGSSSKKQTIGYKYFLGMHLILCHGPIDYLKRIYVDAKLAFQGSVGQSQIYITKKNLFGGEKREGGISGTLDVELGSSTQTKNDYLQSQLGNDIPAFRGVMGVVLRQMYLGNNPYLKRWSFRVQRVLVRQDGIAQWYPSKAPIPLVENPEGVYSLVESFNDPLADNFILNGHIPASVFTIVSDPTFGNVLNVNNLTSDQLNQITYDVTTVQPYFCRLKFKIVASSDGDCALFSIKNNAGLASFRFIPIRSNSVDGLRRPTVILYDDTEVSIGNGVVELGEWYEFVLDYSSPTVVATVTKINGGVHGSVSFSYTPPISTTTFGFQLIADPASTASDVQYTDIELSDPVQLDMNPAHILRECLTDPDWGMGYQDADIDDTSFMAVADALFDERMGMSLLWDRQISIESFVQEIIKHIDGALYVDRATGKFMLTLIRNDYTIGSLAILDESNIDKLENLTRPAFGELTNSVTVNYWDAGTRENASVSVHDSALVQMMNAVVNTTVQYPGFTNQTLAAKVAMRDLKTLSAPLWACTIYTNQTAKNFTVGSVFKLSWSEYGLDEVVMRVTGIAYGDGKNNAIRIQATQDQFALQSDVVLAQPTDAWTPPDQTARAVPYRLLQEAPYYELVQLLGQSTADDELANNNDAGYIVAAGSVTSAEGSPLNAILLVDPDTGNYVDSDTLDFCPIAFLAEDISRTQTTFSIENGELLDFVEVGTHCQIGSELCRVDAISSSSLTVGRAVLDTIPAVHSDGDRVTFWDNFPASDEIQYSATEVVNVKMLTTTGQEVLGEYDAPVDSATMDSRAFRPYPPANLQFNSAYYPESLSGTSLNVTWAHRDRLQQTSGFSYDFYDASIGPEAGVTYELQIWDEDDVLAVTETGLTGTSYPYTDELTEIGKALPLPSGIYEPAGGGPGSAALASFDPADIAATVTLADSDKTVQKTADNFFGARSIETFSTGKYYFEGVGPTVVSGNIMLGVAPDSFDASTTLVSNGAVTYYGQSPGYIWYAGAKASGYGAVVSTDIMMIAVDVDNELMWIGRNGTWLNGDPAAGTGGFDLSTQISPPYCFAATIFYNTQEIQCNFGQTGHTYTPPSGFTSTAGSTTLRLPEKLRVELLSKRDGYECLYPHDITLYRLGWGYSYGTAYGGK